MSKLLVYLGSTLSAITLSTVMIGNVCADQTGNFTDYLGYAKGVAGTALNDQHGFNPGDTFKSYNSHPSQAGYYGGGKQETTNLGQDAVNALPGNEADSAVSQDFLSRPVYEVNQKDPDIKNAKFIQNNSYDISRGISDQYVDCTKKSFCHNTYTQASCTRAKQFDLACHQDLKVQVAPAIVKNFTAKFSEQSSNVGVFTSPYSGKITAISVGLGSYHAFHCNITYVGKILGTIVGQSYTGCGEYNSGISFSSGGLSVPVKKNLDSNTNPPPWFNYEQLLMHV